MYCLFISFLINNLKISCNNFNLYFKRKVIYKLPTQEVFNDTCTSINEKKIKITGINANIKHLAYLTDEVKENDRFILKMNNKIQTLFDTICNNTFELNNLNITNYYNKAK